MNARYECLPPERLQREGRATITTAGSSGLRSNGKLDGRLAGRSNSHGEGSAGMSVIPPVGQGSKDRTNRLLDRRRGTCRRRPCHAG
jgi:hypothetical protein